MFFLMPFAAWQSEMFLNANIVFLSQYEFSDFMANCLNASLFLSFVFSNHASIAMQLDALIHPFFDELRDTNSRLPNGRFLPPLFNFKSHGMISF